VKYPQREYLLSQQLGIISSHGKISSTENYLSVKRQSRDHSYISILKFLPR